jgi:hypothetical protein
MATRMRDCDETFVKGRLGKAEQFLQSAATLRDLADSEVESGDSVVTLCVLAGIAASDVICCKVLGHFVQGDDHSRAVAELSKVSPGGKELGKDLQALLRMKTKAGYGGPAVTAAQRKRAWRRAENLVEAARERA